jgi:hypothetical protein
MTHKLNELIRASGYAGTSGQSFRNHVAGAASGAKMSDYLITAWALSDTPNPAPFSPYADNTTFYLDPQFTQGVRASYIKRVGAVFVVSGSGPYGFSATAVTNNAVGAATGSQLRVLVRSPFSSEQVITTGTPWYVGYSPRGSSYPPPGSGTVPVDFLAQTTYASGSGQQTCSFGVGYTPDAGGFNPDLPSQFYNFPIANRIEGLADFDHEWHSNSTYTSLVSSASSFQIMSAPAYSVTYWYRYRRKISGASWVQLGAVNWSDTRLS